MIGKIYKTKYSSIVHKNSVGECVDVINNNNVNALLIEFATKEKFWFLKRDLKLVECE